MKRNVKNTSKATKQSCHHSQSRNCKAKHIIRCNVVDVLGGFKSFRLQREDISTRLKTSDCSYASLHLHCEEKRERCVELQGDNVDKERRNVWDQIIIRSATFQITFV